MNSKDVLLQYLCDDINNWVSRPGKYVLVWQNGSHKRKITNKIILSELHNDLTKIIFCDGSWYKVDFAFSNNDLTKIDFWHESFWHFIKSSSISFYSCTTLDEVAICMMDNCSLQCCYKNEQFDKNKSVLVDLFSEFDVMRYILCQSIKNLDDDITIEI